jgi:hypothetical protein
MLDQESDQSNGGYLAECVIEWLKFGLSSTVSSNDRWYGKETDVVNETTKKETDQFCTASWAEIMLPTFERQKEKRKRNTSSTSRSNSFSLLHWS